jgi:hypothetical protein
MQKTQTNKQTPTANAPAAAVIPKLNWGREFSKYIKRVQKIPKYQGFSYPCLATQKEIVAEFKRKKERYLAMQKRQEQLLKQRYIQQHKLLQQQKEMRQKLLKQKNLFFQHNQLRKSRRQKQRGGSGSTSRRGGKRKTMKRYRGGSNMDLVMNSIQNTYNSAEGVRPIPSPSPYVQPALLH